MWPNNLDTLDFGHPIWAAENVELVGKSTFDHQTHAVASGVRRRGFFLIKIKCGT